MGKSEFLIASCLWFATSLAPAWAAGPGPFPSGGNPVHGSFSYFQSFAFTEERDPSFSMNRAGLGPSLFQPFSLSFMDQEGEAFQGLSARYEMGLGNHRFEFRGGYVPEMKSLFSSEPPLDPKAYVGYVQLTIPVFQFFFQGGAFVGQNMESMGLLVKPFSEEPNAEKELLGCRIGGGYRFSDALSVQAGWGQAALEHDTAREGLRTWYLQAHIGLGLRMSLVPRVGFIDFTRGDGEKVREEAFYCGARWQISF